MDDDSDLAAAFEELKAPRSTADYASRTPSLEIRTTVSRWPQALATTLAVLVAVGGAGTFLALRSARQGGGPAATAGNPPARAGAAMAYDSTAGVTVMFGGFSASGNPLTDTWTWDGSAWRSAANGPGRLFDIRMVDNPAEQGVLLVGIPVAVGEGSSTGSGTACAIVGTIGGGTGSSGGTPSVVGGSPAAAKGAPAIATAPPVGAPVPPPSSTGPMPTCTPTTVPAPTVQTWLFTAHGWNLAGVGGAASTVPAGAQLTYDPTTHQVLAVASNFFTCGPPLRAATSSSAIACPVMGGASSDNASTPVHCTVANTCPSYGGGVQTWTWNGGYWKQAQPATLQQNGVTLLFEDPATHHATLMTQFDLGAPQPMYNCPSNALCAQPACAPVAASCSAPPVPQVTTFTWSGAAWNQVSQVTNREPAPNLAGAAVASIGGHILVLTTTGQTWHWTAGHWIQASGGPQPSARAGAAMAQGPSGTAVLFGGQPAYSFALSSSSPAAPLGSDTWEWADGAGWKHISGAAPSVPPSPTCPGQVGKAIPPYCVEPQPAQVSPAAPAGSPQPGSASAQGSTGPPATP